MGSQHCLIYVLKEKALKHIALVQLSITGKMCLNKEYRTSLSTFSSNHGIILIHRRNTKRKKRGNYQKITARKLSSVLQTNMFFFTITRKDIDSWKDVSGKQRAKDGPSLALLPEVTELRVTSEKQFSPELTYLPVAARTSLTQHRSESWAAYLWWLILRLS